MIAEQKVLSSWKRFENIVRRAILSLSPNFGTFDRVIYGRIEKINILAGKVDANKKQFSVDIKPLTKNLEDDPNIDIILDVPIDSLLFGNSGGVFSVPSSGAIARIGYMFNDPSLPFVLSITNEGRTIPKAKAAAIRIESDSGVVLQIEGSKIKFKVGLFNTDLDTFLTKFLSHNHLGNLATPVGPPASGVPPVILSDFQTGDL